MSGMSGTAVVLLPRTVEAVYVVGPIDLGAKSCRAYAVVHIFSSSPFFDARLLPVCIAAVLSICFVREKSVYLMATRHIYMLLYNREEAAMSIVEPLKGPHMQ